MKRVYPFLIFGGGQQRLRKERSSQVEVRSAGMLLLVSVQVHTDRVVGLGKARGVEISDSFFQTLLGSARLLRRIGSRGLFSLLRVLGSCGSTALQIALRITLGGVLISRANRTLI